MRRTCCRSFRRSPPHRPSPFPRFVWHQYNRHYRMTAFFEIAAFDGFWQCQAPPTKTLAATDLAAAGENQPEVAQASPDDEAGPAHPHWCSPATDNDWPTHVNPQEMEESHQRKNYAGHHIECSLIHGPILQGFHHNNNGKRHEAVHLIPRNWPAAAPVAWRRPAQGFGLLVAVCTNAASALLRSRAWMTLNIVGTRNSRGCERSDRRKVRVRGGKSRGG